LHTPLLLHYACLIAFSDTLEAVLSWTVSHRPGDPKKVAPGTGAP